MKIRPLGDRVLVEPIAAESKTASGIIIPDTAKEKPQEGKIVAVGTGKMVGDKLVPLEVKVGDKVMFSKYGGDEIKVEGKELKILQESDILAIIE
ncbi:MAG: hypothetical protein ACD_58C00025G0004 [uncultured bacterium]|nr:MAG: hypothetical protein ACD_58C00025G0004 [uncultured bacterium]